MKKLFRILVLLISFFVVSNPVAELNLELPKEDFTQSQVSGVQEPFYSSIKSRSRGLELLRKLRRSGQIIEDPEINLWIRSVGNKLVSRALQSTSPFYFLVSKKTSINAFATDGGLIVVNAGLIISSDSESEVAAVIAHEIAHVTRKHLFRMRVKAKADKFGSSAALVAGVLASTKDAQAGQAIINTTMATMAHKQLSFSREAESEADREGLRILTRAGFNPLAMPAILQKLEQFADTQNADIREFLRSHPLTHKRVTDTLTRAKRLGRFRGRESKQFYFMREKIRVLTNASSSMPNKIGADVKNYGKALQSLGRKHFPNVLKTLGKKSNHTSVDLLIAEALIQTKRYKEALDILLSLSELYPSSEVFLIPLAEVYVAIGQPQKAWQALKGIRISEQMSLEFFEAKQKVAHLAGHSSQAYYASAQRNMRIANYKVAKIQLKKALKQSKNSESLRNIKRDLSLLDNIKSH